jgi:rhamnose utilization protein RhaD (predicted bifunctional aldolase and dehydrogenase)
LLKAPSSLWQQSEAANLANPVAEVVYRSNLLGSDRSLANEGGGNTSVKATADDHTGRTRQVLFVKGSGSDLATATERSFSALRLDWLLETSQRNEMDDPSMVDYLLKSTMTYDQPRPSIETLVHAFIPAAHVDHTHPDAVIALTSSPDGKNLAEEAYGGRAIWLDYIRPGFHLAKQIARALEENPDAEAILMAKHGLVTWGDTGLECYESTLTATLKSVEAMNALADAPLFGGRSVSPMPQAEAEELLVNALPTLRGEV